MPNVFLTTFFFLTCLCRIFGHFSHRSEWQLVKIDFRSIFQHRCTTDDYMTWQLHNEVRESRRHSTVDDTIQSSIKLEWNSLIQSNNKSKMVGKKKEEMKGKGNLWNVYDALFITGRSVHHGDEENLPKTESKRSMCQGQRAVYFPDVRLLPLHRGRFWVVSSLLCSYSVHFIKSNAQHFINLQRHSLWSKTEAQQAECYKTYLL